MGVGVLVGVIVFARVGVVDEVGVNDAVGVPSGVCVGVGVATTGIKNFDPPVPKKIKIAKMMKEITNNIKNKRLKAA